MRYVDNLTKQKLPKAKNQKDNVPGYDMQSVRQSAIRPCLRPNGMACISRMDLSHKYH